GTLTTVYDPAIQETQIAEALSRFDANLTTRLFWSQQSLPVNSSFSAGVFTQSRFPFVQIAKGASPGGTPTFGVELNKRLATGAVVDVAHNIFYQYANNPNQAFPSVYTTQTQFRFSQPLLGGNQQNGPSGLPANRAPIIIARLNADVAVWRFKAEVMAHV